MANDMLRMIIKDAGLREDFMAMSDAAYASDMKCGIACAPGCFLMSPSQT